MGFEIRPVQHNSNGSEMFSNLVSPFATDDTRRLQHGTTDVMSPASTTETSDDSSLTNDDLAVLSDLFGFVTPGSNSLLPSQTTSRPRSRKRARVAIAETMDGSTLPKSQQQRQKQEISLLKNQVVELQATIDKLQARKLERERREMQRAQQEEYKAQRFDNESVNEWGIAERQGAAVQQLEEQNEKLRSQVTTHLGQLKQLEQIARTRYLDNSFPEQKQLAGHSSYYAAC